VNCAGIQNRELITETSAELWDLLQRINSRGLFICLREAAKIMRAAGKGGRIINISSMGSIHPVMPGLAAYNASKAAVNALTRSAALELSGDRITVNAILPGAVATVGAGKAPGPAPSGRVVAGLPPLGRLATPTDIAAAVLLFAGTGGDAITGQTLIVDAARFVRRPMAGTKVFVEDFGADGFKAKPDADTAPDGFEASGKRTAFDANWKDQKLSESEYQQTFTAAEGAYAKMLSALLDQIKKKSGS